MSLQRLIYLCHVKNELNRKRRRFYNVMSGNIGKLTPCPPTNFALYWRERKTNHISKAEATEGYEIAKRDMKAMTYEMRQLRIALNVYIAWGTGGQITAVHNGSQPIPAKEFEKHHDDEVFETVVL